MSVFKWAKFRSTKSGIKIHTQIDIITEIPVSYRVTTAKVHDVNFMDWLAYEPLACYVFDRGYFDLARLFAIEQSEAFFVIREKGCPDYEVKNGEDILEAQNNILRDQTVRFAGKRNKKNYPASIRRIVYYAPDLKRTFTYYTNNFYLTAEHIALLYKYRWQVELFLSGLNNTLGSKPFGVSRRMRFASRYTSLSSFTVSLVSSSMTSSWADLSLRSCAYWGVLVKDNIRDLLKPLKTMGDESDKKQLHIEFEFD
jgi:hypothetical protein